MYIKILPILKNYIYEVLDILNVRFGSPLTTSSKNEYIDDPDILNFISEINNYIIRTPALYLIKKNNRKISLIEDFSVLEYSERKGVEKLIIEHLIKLVKIEGAYKTILNSNKKNELFYPKIGFKTEQIRLVKHY